MLDVIGVIKAVVEVAGGVHRHLSDRARVKEEAARDKSSTQMASRLQQLEDSDLQQAQLLDEVSQNLAELGKAIAVEVEKNRQRDAWVARLVYLTLGLSLAALAVALLAVFR